MSDPGGVQDNRNEPKYYKSTKGLSLKSTKGLSLKSTKGLSHVLLRGLL